MKQITKEEDLVGKTIVRTAYGSNIFLLEFKDREFCIFKGCGWDENDVELMDEAYNTEPSDWNYKELFELGIITQELAAKFSKQIEAKRAKDSSVAERAKYEELKAKFEK